MSKSAPLITLVNVQTGEEITREMTAQEIAELEQAQSANAVMQAEAEAKAAARQSALEKLAALGLTEAEIQALAG